MSNNPDSHKLLAVVSPVHHKGVCKTLDNRALSFPETFASIATGGMRYVHRGADLNVVAGEREVLLVQFRCSVALYRVSSSWECTYVNEMSLISTSS